MHHIIGAVRIVLHIMYIDFNFALYITSTVSRAQLRLLITANNVYIIKYDHGFLRSYITVTLYLVYYIYSIWEREHQKQYEVQTYYYLNNSLLKARSSHSVKQNTSFMTGGRHH